MLLKSLPSKATEIPLIFPCWMNTVNEFFLSASPATKPAPWQVTFVEAIFVVTCGRANSINKSVFLNCEKVCNCFEVLLEEREGRSEGSELGGSGGCNTVVDGALRERLRDCGGNLAELQEGKEGIV